MTEGKLLAPCLKLMRAELTGFVVKKHNDGMTSGNPDVSVDGRKRTTWWEFKYGPKIKWANALQQLTCRRLAVASFSCLVVLYEEIDDTRRTVILTPDEVEISSVPGFNNQFILDLVRSLHAA